MVGFAALYPPYVVAGTPGFPGHAATPATPENPDISGVFDTLITWSGTLGPDLETGDPRNWMGPGYRALMAICAAMMNDDPALAPPGQQKSVRTPKRVLFRTHARHVLSDGPSARLFLKDSAAEGRGDRFGIVLSPATMLEPVMLDTASEHIERFFELLGDHAAMIYLSDAAPDAAGDRFVAVPLGEGVVSGSLVRQLLERCVPATTPIVTTADDAARLDSWLG